MASTTLVTFLFQSPRYASRVEILGSWDNFAKAYPLQRDSVVSSTSWKGCHSFSGIVCDGDVVAMNNSTRDGALLMGGTYWYYYRLDDEVECHDPMVTSTRGCPFLPGQEVNVLEVPVQKNGHVTVGSIASLQDIFTTDPTAKFTSPKRQLTPVAPVAAQHNEVYNSELTIPVHRTSSLRNTLFSNLPKFSLARSRTMVNQRIRTAISASRVTTPLEQIRPFSENDAKAFADDWSSEIHSVLGGCPNGRMSRAPSVQFRTDDQNNAVQPPLSDEECLGAEFLDFGLCESVSGISDGLPSITDALEDCEWPYHKEENTASFVEGQNPAASTSDRTSGVFSLLSGSIGSPVATNRHSSFHAQPQTPSLDFEGFSLEPFRLDFSSLDDAIIAGDAAAGFTNSKECSTLSLALQSQATASFKDLNHTVKLSPLEKLDMVESWRHGESPSTVTEHEPSALQELINDLGYLSALID